MKCEFCGRVFSRVHKVTKICQKCKHLHSTGRPTTIHKAVTAEATKSQVQSAADTLLHWLKDTTN